MSDLKVVLFVDGKSVEHAALVKALRDLPVVECANCGRMKEQHIDGRCNPADVESKLYEEKIVHGEPLATLVYLDGSNEAVTVFDVPHITHPSRQEANPALPNYPVNAWKRIDEEHKALPEDHPQFDHPHEQPKFNNDGQRILKERPKYDGHLAAHQQTAEPTPSTAKDAEEEQNLSASIGGSSLPMGAGPKHCDDPGCEICSKGAAAIELGHPALVSATEVPNPAPVAGMDVNAQTPEPDVTAQLDAAGPAPVVEEEKKPEDPA